MCCSSRKTLNCSLEIKLCVHVWACLLLVSNHPPKPCRHPVSPAVGADWRIAALMWIRETPVIHPSTQHPSTQVRKEQREAFTNKVFIVQIKSSTCANHLIDLGHHFFYFFFSPKLFCYLSSEKIWGRHENQFYNHKSSKVTFARAKMKN